MFSVLGKTIHFNYPVFCTLLIFQNEVKKQLQGVKKSSNFFNVFTQQVYAVLMMMMTAIPVFHTHNSGYSFFR